jgi:hypothetical protein
VGSKGVATFPTVELWQNVRFLFGKIGCFLGGLAAKRLMTNQKAISF